MNAPVLSLVTVCRNSASELPSAAASVLAALGEADEWVVQDGASTDGSVECLRGLGDPRVRLERVGRTGASTTR